MIGEAHEIGAPTRKTQELRPVFNEVQPIANPLEPPPEDGVDGNRNGEEDKRHAQDDPFAPQNDAPEDAQVSGSPESQEAIDDLLGDSEIRLRQELVKKEEVIEQECERQKRGKEEEPGCLRPFSTMKCNAAEQAYCGGRAPQQDSQMGQDSGEGMEFDQRGRVTSEPADRDTLVFGYDRQGDEKRRRRGIDPGHKAD